MFIAILPFQVLVTTIENAPAGGDSNVLATACRNAVGYGLLDQLGEVAQRVGAGERRECDVLA
jgi:hypothetical protein